MVGTISPNERDLERIVNAIRNGLFATAGLIETFAQRVVYLSAATASSSTITIDADGVARAGDNTAIIGTTAPPRPFSLRGVTCNISTAGPAANGRDQAGAFGAAAHVTFYAIIKKDGTVATIASVNSQAPTLPTDYTHYCYLFTAVLSGGNLQNITVLGDLVRYNVVQLILNAGTSTGTAGSPTTSIAVNTHIAYTAKSSLFLARFGNFAASTSSVNVGFVSGSSAFLLTAEASEWGGSEFEFPTVDPIFYAVSQAGAAVDIWAAGYREPNGGWPG